MASEKKAPARKKTSAEQAAELAAKIRDDMANRKRLQPGDVVGGDRDHWRYVHVPADPQTRDRLEAKLQGRGYVLCSDGEKMVGMNQHRIRVVAISHSLMLLKMQELREKLKISTQAAVGLLLMVTLI